jgi:hypothetical protein
MELDDEESWLQAIIAYLRMVTPLVAIPRAETTYSEKTSQRRIVIIKRAVAQIGTVWQC